MEGVSERPGGGISGRLDDERRVAGVVYPAPTGRRVRVEFTEYGRQTCWKIAKRRNWRSHGRNDRADWFGMDHMEANYVGVLGEAAFAMYMGANGEGFGVGDVQVYDGYGDTGVDFDLGTYTVQVKATRAFDRPVLSVGTWEHRNADFYVLCAYDKTSRYIVDVVGYVSSDDLDRIAPVSFKGRKATRRIKEADLSKFERPTEVEYGYV